MATLEVPDSVAAELQAQARAQGLSLDQYLQLMIDTRATSSAVRAEAATAAVREFDDAMDELFAANVRSMPADCSTHSREEIYFDHN